MRDTAAGRRAVEEYGVRIVHAGDVLWWFVQNLVYGIETGEGTSLVESSHLMGYTREAIVCGFGAHLMI